jgi:DNA helicase HerA-like ATPase
LYATFLLWLLSELFEELPEVGNPDKPKLVFFFDEAHLLFDGAPKALVHKVEQVARLTRSKGVGVYFVTQNPADIPDDVLGQLGNRVQHALRAFTAKDRKELKTASETYRDNPDFDTAEAIQQVGTGEAVTSFLDRKGIPQVVQRTLIRPPSSQLGPIDRQTRAAIMSGSDMAGKYDITLNRESASEMLAKRAGAAAAEAEAAEAAEEAAEEKEREFKKARRYDGGRTTSRSTSRRSSKSDSFGVSLANVVMKEPKGTTGRRILGGFFQRALIKVAGSLTRRSGFLPFLRPQTGSRGTRILGLQRGSFVPRE